MTLRLLALVSALAAALLSIAAIAARPAAPASFAQALPGYRWQFPRDDGAHPAFANEWWYFTGNLAAAKSSARYGFELTFFRIAPWPGARLDDDIYLAHFAVTAAPGALYRSEERVRRGAWAQAGVASTAAGVRVWNENWSVVFDRAGPRRLQAAWAGTAVDLTFAPGAERVLNGVAGLSQKSDGAGRASEYYSFPRLAASGTLAIGGRDLAVTGEVWMDHEFGSNQLGPSQQGWDWLGLQLQDGSDLMLFNLRDAGAARDPHSAGTFTPADATESAQPLTAADFSLAPTRWWRSPATRIRYPVAWTLRVPGRHLALTVAPLIDAQEFHSPALNLDYWEGAVTVSGTRAGVPIAGRGYLELTGYGRRFNLLEAPQ